MTPPALSRKHNLITFKYFLKNQIELRYLAKSIKRSLFSASDGRLKLNTSIGNVNIINLQNYSQRTVQMG